MVIGKWKLPVMEIMKMSEVSWKPTSIYLFKARMETPEQHVKSIQK